MGSGQTGIAGENVLLTEIQERKVSLIEQQLNIEVAGKKTAKVFCPFHHDDNPSLAVFRNGSWRCFVCNIGGDILDFIGYQQHGLAYTRRGDQLKDIIDLIARQGITPYTDEDREKAYTDDRDPISIRQGLWLKAHTAHKNLKNNPERRMTLYDWGLTEQVIEECLFGWDGSRYTIPSMYRGVVFSIKRRLPQEIKPDKENPKYTSVPGSSWGGWGLDRIESRLRIPNLVVAEDEKSAAALVSDGALAVASSGGAGFWRSPKGRWWATFIGRAERLFFWRDADELTRPAYDPTTEYEKGDQVHLINTPSIYEAKVKNPTEPPSWKSDHWKAITNPGLQCALDFRRLFPRAVIVSSYEYKQKDAGDFVSQGLNWCEVLGNW